MRDDDSRIDRTVVIRSIRVQGVDGRLIVGSVRDCEIGERGNADGRRRDEGSNWRFENCGWLWNGRGLGELRFGISVGKSEGCGNGCCSGVSLVRANLFGLPGREHRWGRETLPTTLP